MGSKEDQSKSVDVDHARTRCTNCTEFVDCADESCPHCGKLGPFPALLLRDQSRLRIQRALKKGQLDEEEMTIERNLSLFQQADYVIDLPTSFGVRRMFLSKNGMKSVVEEMMAHTLERGEGGRLERIEKTVREMQAVMRRLILVALENNQLHEEDLTRTFPDYFEHEQEILEEKGKGCYIDLR